MHFGDCSLHSGQGIIACPSSLKCSSTEFRGVTGFGFLTLREKTNKKQNRKRTICRGHPEKLWNNADNHNYREYWGRGGRRTWPPLLTVGDASKAERQIVFRTLTELFHPHLQPLKVCKRRRITEKTNKWNIQKYLEFGSQISLWMLWPQWVE